MINPRKSNLKQFFEEEIKKFLGLFVFLSLIFIIIISWGTIKGMFDYKTIYGDIINSFKKVEEKKEVAIKVPEIGLSSSPKEFPFTEKPDGIEIPKIEVEAPLIFIESDEEKDYQEALKKGVVHYTGSALPGEEGQIIILGHSAPSFWPKKDYNWIFKKLNELEVGDEVFVNYQNHQYRYLVYGKIFLNPGAEIPEADLTNSDNVLFLIS